VLTDRDGAGLVRVAADLQATSVVADLEDPDAPARIARSAQDRFGRIDGLVNAAGLTTRASFQTGTTEVWETLFAVNARAGFFLMQAAIADMLRRQDTGTIVNILSVNAHCGVPELAIYSASKGAMATLTRNAARAHMADRIRVNGINLGWVATPTERALQAALHGEDWLDAQAAAHPLGRLVTPDECARLTAFLLSDVSAPLTGALIDLEQKVLGAF
jgi:NAD(P)-dependent dehydrogenase (short-subunit alcohol dehydrogenase family)